MAPIGLFEAYGIEIELMIVDGKDLNVQPWADRLLTEAAGQLVSDFEDGPITWSNELVSHVIEFKTSAPAKTLENLETQFYQSQRRASALLAKLGARLMPTGMHPWMNPVTETHLWPHDNNEIYSLYNQIFDCKGHGWSNLQSVHINLPFKNESEFKRLHSAIRAILPLIPALSASTPIADARPTGSKDTRLVYYETNQKRLPIIAGDVIPVALQGFEDYRTKISNPIQIAVHPFDSKGLLRGDWLNSRGAIARIDRGTIEIRLIDTQECAHADLAIVQFIVEVVKTLTANSDFLSQADSVSTKAMHAIFQNCVKNAETALIDDPNYLALLGAKPGSSQELWRHMRKTFVKSAGPRLDETFNQLLERPSLATRIQTALGENPSPDRLKFVYTALCNCLDKNEIFTPTSV